MEMPIINAYEIKTGMSRAKLSLLMDAETWMDAHTAIDMGFADEILARPAETPVENNTTGPMLFSRAAVTNFLMDKLVAKCCIKKPETPERSVDSLMERLQSLPKHLLLILPIKFRYRYQQGKVQINHNRFLGYTKDTDGNLVIDPEQAETVKRIYREYLEGLSMDKIAAGLERDGILTGAGGKKWHTSTINKILRNEKYIGDALLQKTYTTDFLNKTRVKNNGLVPQYYVEVDHEAIIPKDIYLQVQEELVRRRVVKTSANGKKRSYSCNHCFSQIVICGECGEMFRRLHWNNRGVKSIVWRCISRLESIGLECHARTINELVLQDAVVKAINQMLGDKSNYQAQLQLNIAAVIRASQATAIDSIDEKLMALQQELIQKANSKEDYDEIADEIFRLRELRQKTTVDTAARDEQIKRINDLQDYISQQTALLTEFDEALVRRWIKQITIWDDRITVELKSGVSIDVDA